MHRWTTLDWTQLSLVVVWAALDNRPAAPSSEQSTFRVSLKSEEFNSENPDTFWTSTVCYCAAVMCRQWRCRSGRALGMAGPGRHCSTVMSPLPVWGAEKEGGVWNGGRTHRSAKLFDKGQKKEAVDDGCVWLPNQSRHSWLNSVSSSSFFFLFFFYNTTKQINEPGGSVRTELESAADRCHSEKGRNL